MTVLAIEQEFSRLRQAISPRFRPPPTPWRSRLIHVVPVLLLLLLCVPAFGARGVLAWSPGLAYIGYDTVLLGFVFCRTLTLLHPLPEARVNPLPAASVIVASRNEAAVLPVTLAALLAQTWPAAMVVVADDGSDDGTAALLQREYGLPATPLGALSGPTSTHRTLRWLRLPHGGKARALNVACAHCETELLLTVDADTLLEPDALAGMAAAFAASPALVAATGVLTPVCGPSLSGRLLQWFQTYEYVRNFLSRYAWMREDGLLLISGAFACFRRDALFAVGGFDPDCLVEDYELIHRLRDHAGRRGLGWRTAVVGEARAKTDAPATPGAFLRQRRRWFGGFLQTQFWYRHMVGTPLYGRLGTRMLPVKALDTLQPLYGLTGVGLLLYFLLSGRFSIVTPVAVVIGAKIVLDLGFHLWSLRLYRRWAGGSGRLYWWSGTLAALVEPFSFQLLRHVGAALGWIWVLTGARSWGVQRRLGVAGYSRP
jgi:cellulose synthase/poly-beta-1,6-N-acetylglucosamine synthase-like glycosyltransferase